MIEGLKAYPGYKPSGSTWLGAVPSHWEVRSLGAMTTRFSSRNRPDLPLLSVVRERGVVPRASMSTEENHNYVPDDLSHYRVVRAGNLVINKMKAWQGSLGIAPIDGIVSPAYYVFDFAIENLLFGQALLRSRTYVDFFARVSDGVRIGQWDLSIDGMRRIPLAVPPPDEQAAIVRFLDHADRRIRRYIKAKKKLIKLLEEQTKTIIQQVISHGIDAGVQRKPSGLEWLGDVPSHWCMRKLGALFAQIGSGTTPVGDSYYGGGVPWLMTGDLNNGVIQTTRRSVTKEAVESVGALRLYRKGSLVIAMYGATIGKTGILGLEACTNQACCVLTKQHESTLTDYIQAVMNLARPSLVERGKGGGQPNVNADIVRRFIVPIPPISEQRRIVSFIDYSSIPIREAVKAARCHIGLMTELRTRLIADVVTGQIDVRAAAASLPDDPEDVEPLDEPEEPGDVDLDPSADPEAPEEE